jgi:hypothetical protein
MWYECVKRIHMDQNVIQWKVLVNMDKNLRIPWKTVNFYTTQTNFSFSRRTPPQWINNFGLNHNVEITYRLAVYIIKSQRMSHFSKSLKTCRLASNFSTVCSEMNVVSLSDITYFRLVAQSAATCSLRFLARGLFYPEDGGDTFLRNVSLHKIYSVLNPRRRHSA